MKIRISELFSSLDAPEIPLEEKNVVSTENIKSSVFQKIQGENRDRKTIKFPKIFGFRLAPGLAAAVLLIVMIPTTAFAAVAISHIFSYVESLFPWEDSLGIEIPNREEYTQHILDNADNTQQTITVESFSKAARYIGEPNSKPYCGPELPGFTFDLLESYYDGSRLLLGHRITLINEDSDIPFGPESEHFNLLQSCDKGDYSIDFSDILGDQRVSELYKEYLRNGNAGCAVQVVYVSDHAYLKNGNSFSTYMTEETPDGTFMYFYDPAQKYDVDNPPQSWLIDEAQNLDELTVGFKVRSYWLYYYIDDTGSYYYQAPTAEEMVYFTIDNVQS